MFLPYIHIKTKNDNYYVYDVFTRSFHLSNHINYELDKFCKENNLSVIKLCKEEKEIFAQKEGISVL